jgi:hypothetical protein
MLNYRLRVLRNRTALILIGCISIVLFGSFQKTGADLDRFQINSAAPDDTNAITQKLLGKWKLTSWECSECADPGWHKPDKTVIATLRADRKFSITVNSETVSQGTWYFIKVAGEGWQLYSKSDISYLRGRIYFKDNTVQFSNSQYDGPNNLFERVE